MINKRELTKNHTPKIPKGFSLIELLLVAATIPVLIMIAVTAINPAKKLAEARNIERLSNIQAIINGVYQFSIKNNGLYPTSISYENKEICRMNIDEKTCLDANGVYLKQLTQLEFKYLATIPYDPGGEACNLPEDIGTCYFIKFDQNENNLVISAPHAELGANINISY